MILSIKDINGEWIEIPAIVGPAGPKGEDYVITPADYEAIADVVLSSLVDAEEVSY